MDLDGKNEQGIAIDKSVNFPFQLKKQKPQKTVAFSFPASPRAFNQPSNAATIHPYNDVCCNPTPPFTSHVR